MQFSSLLRLFIFLVYLPQQTLPKTTKTENTLNSESATSLKKYQNNKRKTNYIYSSNIKLVFNTTF